MVTLALLGDSRAALPYLQACADNSSLRLSTAALAGSLAHEVVAVSPGVRLVESWEALLDDGIDGVIVAGAAEPVLEGARRLATEGKPLLVLPDSRQGTTFYYELSLIRDDNQVALLPALPLRMLPDVVGLRQELDSQRLGRLVQIQVEREIPCPAGAGPAPLTPALVESLLLDDADLIRSLGGNYSRVTALQAGAVDGRFSSATVTLAGDGLPDALWVARPAQGDPHDIDDRPQARLTITGTAGRRELPLGSAVHSGSQTASPAVDALLQAFVHAIEGKSPQPDWTALIRAGEVVDGARRSVARRRTIDLYHETASERGQFKSHMTAIGCGVILLTLVLVVVLLMVGAAVNLPPRVMIAARILVFAPLFVYLLLQGLVFVARPSRSDAPATAERP